MRHLVASIIIALACAAGSCSSDAGDGSETGAAGCTPGEQVSCACPGGGVDGVQVCTADGAGFGACMGCGEASSGGAGSGSGDDDGTIDTTGTMPMGSSGPGTDDGETTSPPGGSEGGDAFAWVWVDHPGPAFLPPPCAAAAGVMDGLLVDPQAFFTALVAGADPDDWVAVMNAIEPDLWACGLGQQRDSGGEVRGRLFLPSEACPNAAPPPDDAMAVFLGVNQNPPCWDHPVDVVSEL